MLFCTLETNKKFLSKNHLNPIIKREIIKV